VEEGFGALTMKILATLPTKGRDIRLDLFRGVANWGIFLDHIPNNIVNWVTAVRNRCPYPWVGRLLP